MSLIKIPSFLLCLFGAALAVSGVAVAQRLSPPDPKETRSPTERAAYDKALCVYRAMTDAGKVFTPATGATKITPEIQARAKAELDQFEQAARRGVRACLSDREVYNLGRYSFLEDMTFAVGSPCKLNKAPAARFVRTPNNNDGDIANGATRWAEQTALDAHPFFKGQSDAREQFRARPRAELCRVILTEYGPNGALFAGLVRR
jgi:hypothetical protein